MKWKFNSKLHLVEAELCQWAKKNFSSTDQCCYGDPFSLTKLSNISVDFINQSKKCISTSRRRDGFSNCANNNDELFNETTFALSNCIPKKRRYRFRCSDTELTCF